MPAIRSRRLVPEILDGLAPDDPRAAASRRDLARVNLLMGHAGIVAGLLRKGLARPPRRILEIGAGDGRFMLGLARQLARRWTGVEVVLLDRQDLLTAERVAAFGALGWRARPVTADVFDWAAGAGETGFDAVVANLFLHHFDDAGLARLLSLVAPLAPVCAAAEPRRATLALGVSKLLLAIGANDVTRHDAPASVRAGFADKDLTALWPRRGGDKVEEGRAGLFTHAFLARPSRERDR